MTKEKKQSEIGCIILPRQVNYLKESRTQKKPINLLKQPLLYFSNFYNGSLIGYQPIGS